MPRVRLFAVAVLLVTALGGASTRSAGAQPSDGAYAGYLAARVGDDGQLEVVASENADRLLTPASVLKVVTVAAALDLLGPEYQWSTRLETSSGVEDGVVQGDLVLVPGADPTWNDEIIEPGGDAVIQALADMVQAGGVRRVEGNLVVDTARFPGRRHPTDRDFSDLPYRFGTPPAPLAVNDATVMVTVGAGAEMGAPVSVTAPDALEIVNLARTVGQDRHGEGTLDLVPLWGTDTLLLRGEFPISEPSFRIAVSDPAPMRRVARRLVEVLADRGIELGGTTRLTPLAPDSGRRGLAELQSTSLSEVLTRVLTDSHNWTADMLVLTLGREVAGTGRFDDGVEAVSEFLERVAGADTSDEAWSLEDGSGLSAANLITPRAVVSVLTYALRQPWGPTLFEGFATPGQGTLESWPALPPLSAKTGTLQHTVGLAGLLRPDSTDPILFCYFVNHHTSRPSAARQQIAATLAGW